MIRHLHQWVQIKGLTLKDLSDQTGIPQTLLREIQSGDSDPPLSTLEKISTELQIPLSWLHLSPQAIQRLWNDQDDDDPTLPATDSPDPLFERIFQASREHQEVFTLLTNLIHYGDPKLIRAAQVNLQSLFKQARNTTVPWGSRPPGHFEPPSD